MATVIVTFKVMPNSPDVDLKAVEHAAMAKITAYAQPKDTRVDIEPIAFGVNALKLTFVMDESQGSTEPLEQQISEIEGVQSVEVVDVRRAIG